MPENGGRTAEYIFGPSDTQSGSKPVQSTLAIPFSSLHFALVPPIGGWGLVSASEGHAWPGGGWDGTGRVTTTEQPFFRFTCPGPQYSEHHQLEYLFANGIQPLDWMIVGCGGA